MKTQFGSGVTRDLRSAGQWVLLATLALFTPWAPSASAAQLCDTLVSTLENQSSIENPLKGPAGTFGGGTFVYDAVLNRNVLRVDQSTQMLVTFPGSVVNGTRGSIEFDAKLNGFPSVISVAKDPWFVQITDPSEANRYAIGFNSNDGAGNGGLTGAAGDRNATGTGYFGSWTYHDALGPISNPDPAAWHHYQMIWDEQGIPGLAGSNSNADYPNILRVVAVYVDGVQNSYRWESLASNGFTPLPAPNLPLTVTGTTLSLVSSNAWGAGESIDMANLRIQGVPEPSTMVLAGLAAGAVLGLKVSRRRRT